VTHAPFAGQISKIETGLGLGWVKPLTTIAAGHSVADPIKRANANSKSQRHFARNATGKPRETLPWRIKPQHPRGRKNNFCVFSLAGNAGKSHAPDFFVSRGNPRGMDLPGAVETFPGVSEGIFRANWPAPFECEGQFASRILQRWRGLGLVLHVSLLGVFTGLTSFNWTVRSPFPVK
jgi:hypothetical protein